MAVTYEAIATQTLGSSTSSVTFSSIPQTYTDLHIVFNGTSSAAGAVGLGFRFNSDSSGNYSYRILYGSGSSAAINYSSNTTEGYFGNVWTTQATSTADILGYSSSNTYKTVLARTDGAANRVALWASTWRSTSAITSLEILTTNSDTYQAGSIFTLYGIKAA